MASVMEAGSGPGGSGDIDASPSGVLSLGETLSLKTPRGSEVNLSGLAPVSDEPVCLEKDVDEEEEEAAEEVRICRVVVSKGGPWTADSLGAAPLPPCDRGGARLPCHESCCATPSLNSGACARAAYSLRVYLFGG